MQLYWTKIQQIIDETPEVKTFLLERPADFTWEEGAHTHFALKGFNEGEKPNKGLVRHMSISTLPADDTVGITTRIKEQCSEFKSILKTMQVGDEVALFKIHSNVPLQRTNKKLYFLSAGVGLATFKPLALTYLQQPENIAHVHSLNVDSSKDFLFTDVFQSAPDKNFTAQYVDNRADYYAEVEKLAADADGIFYIIGSDEFLRQNVDILFAHGIPQAQIVLDKRAMFLEKFFAEEATV